jgi:hypothetical protein
LGCVAGSVDGRPTSPPSELGAKGQIEMTLARAGAL